MPLLASTTVLSTAAAIFFALGGLDRFALSSTPGDQADGAAKSTPLQQANSKCGLIGQLSDNGRTLVLDGAGQDAGTGSVLANDFACVLAELDTPTYVTEQMNITRALDGQQTAAWGSLEARWTYHPDAGLNLIIHQK